MLTDTCFCKVKAKSLELGTFYDHKFTKKPGEQSFFTKSKIRSTLIYMRTSKSLREGGGSATSMSRLLLFLLLKKIMFHCKFTYNYVNTFRTFRDAYCVKGRQADRQTDTLTDILFCLQRSLE